MRSTTTPAHRLALVAAGLGLVLACRSEPEPDRPGAAAAPSQGRVTVVRDTTAASMLEAAGTAEPVRRARTSSTLGLTEPSTTTRTSRSSKSWARHEATASARYVSRE